LTGQKTNSPSRKAGRNEPMTAALVTTTVAPPIRGE
jgi:hypothetical protein